MPLEPTWYDVTIRLLLTIFAGGCIGINRGEHGQPAGMRTTILVCLAASVSMIQANLLLNTIGKASDSFIVLDLMRLPLGILSGMGFIGAGAILRRGSMVMGVTTAATLWYVTVMGLCFGGGQLSLGLVMLILGIVVLWTLKWFEEGLKQDCRGMLRLRIERDALSEDEVRGLLTGAGLRVKSCAVRYSPQAQRRYLRCDLRWRGYVYDTRTPEVIERLARHEGVSRLSWEP
ncbi:MAG TPA: MgtC/SapB family protein [Pirellulales bacterium]|nr:MgtC/SapB family protein [Pirellulales bacterium]